jgi:hypothetical protein
MSVTALSLDPIAQFLRDRHLPGTSEDVIERDRVRLAEFRHAFPGLSLQRLGDAQIAEYCSGMGNSRSPSEIEEIRRLCKEFAHFAHKEPTLGSGLLRLPGPQPERESPYMLDDPAPGAVPIPPPAAAPAPSALPTILKIGLVGVLLIAAAVLVKTLLL